MKGQVGNIRQEVKLMRLSEEQIAAIRDVVRQEVGLEARVRVFGSRLDDERRGGPGPLCRGQSSGGESGMAVGPHFRSTDSKHARVRCGCGFERA